MTVTCCKNCNKRKIDCHSSCKDYQKARLVNEVIKQKKALAAEADLVTVERRKSMSEHIARARQRGVAMR